MVTSTPEAARRYVEGGWAVIPIPTGSKSPNLSDWTKLRIPAEDVPSRFNDYGNVGVLLGEPSRGLVDADLDSAQAIALAPHFLPTTNAVFGRASKQRSHLLYLVEPAPATVRFCDTDGTSLLELRSTGAQTIFPPSVHPSGEAIKWEQDGEPAHVELDELRRAMRRLAAATLLVRHYPAEGSRHELALAISGALIRAGWTPEAIANFLRAVADVAGDPERRDRASAGEYSAKRVANGRPATGWARLEKLIGPQKMRQDRSAFRGKNQRRGRNRCAS